MNGEKVEAIKYFKALCDKYPNDSTLGQTLYNIAYVYEEISLPDSALIWYGEVLSRDIIDNLAESRFPDTHWNLKHKASHNIGHIFYSRKQYQKASDYYLKSYLEYSYVSSSATSKKKDDMTLVTWLADCYEKIGKLDSLYWVLLPHALTDCPSSQNYIAERLLKGLLNKNARDNFRKEIDQALDLVKKGRDNTYAIKFRGKAILIEPYAEQYSTLLSFTKSVKEKEFYQGLIRVNGH